MFPQVPTHKTTPCVHANADSHTLVRIPSQLQRQSYSPRRHRAISSSAACRTTRLAVVVSRLSIAGDADIASIAHQLNVVRTAVIATYCDSVQPLRPTTASQAARDGKDLQLALATKGNLRWVYFTNFVTPNNFLRVVAPLQRCVSLCFITQSSRQLNDHVRFRNFDLVTIIYVHSKKEER